MHWGLNVSVVEEHTKICFQPQLHKVQKSSTLKLVEGRLLLVPGLLVDCGCLSVEVWAVGGEWDVWTTVSEGGVDFYLYSSLTSPVNVPLMKGGRTGRYKL